MAAPSEFRTVLEVRRSAYAGRAAPSQLNSLLSDEDDGQPHSRSYLLVAPGGELAGTIRPSVSAAEFGWPQLPMDALYPREMERLRKEGKPIIQSSRFGVVPQFRHLGTFATLSLARAVCGVARSFGVDRLVSLSSARPTKLRFWARLSWHAAAPTITHPFDSDGAVLVTGSIAEALRVAAGNEKLRVMTEFPLPISWNGIFPLET